MPTITGPILDSAGKPANGFIRVSASRAFDTETGHVTTAWAIARVVEGEPLVNGALWALPSTPEGVWFNLEQELDGEQTVKYGVKVPETESITYSVLLFNRGGAGGTWDTFWWDLTGDIEFPPEAIFGDMGIDLTTGDLWRNV